MLAFHLIEGKACISKPCVIKGYRQQKHIMTRSPMVGGQDDVPLTVYLPARNVVPPTMNSKGTVTTTFASYALGGNCNPSSEASVIKLEVTISNDLFRVRVQFRLESRQREKLSGNDTDRVIVETFSAR